MGPRSRVCGGLLIQSLLAAVMQATHPRTRVYSFRSAPFEDRIGWQLATQQEWLAASAGSLHRGLTPPCSLMVASATRKAMTWGPPTAHGCSVTGALALVCDRAGVPQPRGPVARNPMELDPEWDEQGLPGDNSPGSHYGITWGFRVDKLGYGVGVEPVSMGDLRSAVSGRCQPLCLI